MITEFEIEQQAARFVDAMVAFSGDPPTLNRLLTVMSAYVLVRSVKPEADAEQIETMFLQVRAVTMQLRAALAAQPSTH